MCYCILASFAIVLFAMLTNVYFQAIYRQLESSNTEVYFSFDTCNSVASTNHFFATNDTHLFAKKRIEIFLYTSQRTTDALNLYYQKLNAQDVVKNTENCSCIVKVIK